MRWILCAMLLLALLAGVRPAGATVGGERLCEVLGYEPSTQRVYVREHDGSGAASFGFVSFLTVTGEDAGTLHSAGWGRAGENSAEDPELARRLAALRAKLTPLRPLIWPALPFASRVAASDSVANELGVSRRLRVRASFDSRLDLDVTCWRSDDVVRPAVFELPGGMGWIWVVAFVGDPFETGYETQVPLLVRPGDSGVRAVEWRPRP